MFIRHAVILLSFITCVCVCVCVQKADVWFTKFHWTLVSSHIQTDSRKNTNSHIRPYTGTHTQTYEKYIKTIYILHLHSSDAWPSLGLCYEKSHFPETGFRFEILCKFLNLFSFYVNVFWCATLNTYTYIK